MIDGPNLTTIVCACIGAVSAITVAILTYITYKNPPANQLTPGSQPSQGRVSWTVKGASIVALILLMMALGLGFWSLKTPGPHPVLQQCARQYVQIQKASLAAVLRSVRSYIYSDFHWPADGELDVQETLKSISTQREIIHQKVLVFNNDLDRIRAAFGKNADGECDDAMRIANEIKKQILDALQKPSTNAAALKMLKPEILKKLQDFSEQLDPQSADNQP